MAKYVAATADRALIEAANKRLVGSDKLKELIRSALNFGSNSVLDQSYQVKTRTKHVNSLVEKVLRKRAEVNPNYGVEDVTDIIGVRFLVLFKQELISLIEGFVDFLEEFQGNPTDLFEGNSLQDSLKEVIVYQTNTATESYQTIFKFLKSFCVARGFPDDFVRLETRDTKYSSVHIVALGKVHLGDEVRTIPIEFQLRTVFEDIWSEVEHRLIYKNPKLDDTDEGRIRKRMGQLLMTQLKDELDVSSQGSDLAYFELLFESAVDSSRSAASSRSIVVLESLKDFLPTTTHENIAALRTRIVEVYDRLATDDLDTSSLALSEEFHKLRNEISSAKMQWASLYPQRRENDIVFQYMMDMEIAASFYWEGQLSNKSSDKTEIVAKEVDAKSQKLFESARQLYFDLAAIPEYANDPVLNFRIGEIYRNLGQLRIAQVYFETSYSAMEKGDWIGQGTIFESIIPRQLAYLYWLQSNELSTALLDGASHGNGDAPNLAHSSLGRQILSKLSSAFEVTFDLDLVEFSVVDKERSDAKHERSICYNNTLSYALEYLERGGEHEKLVALSSGGFDYSFYERIYDYFPANSEEKIDIRIVESGLRAAVLFEDFDRGAHWYRRAIEWRDNAKPGSAPEILVEGISRAIKSFEENSDQTI